MYTVIAGGTQIQCSSEAEVIGAVRALKALKIGEEAAPPQRAAEREVAVPNTSEARGGDVLAQAIYDLYRESPTWRRPVEIIAALKQRGIRKPRYQNVYTVLRYGDFVRDGGRWNVSDAA